PACGRVTWPCVFPIRAWCATPRPWRSRRANAARLSLVSHGPIPPCRPRPISFWPSMRMRIPRSMRPWCPAWPMRCCSTSSPRPLRCAVARKCMKSCGPPRTAWPISASSPSLARDRPMIDLRVFVASLATETNTFSPIRIDRSAFEDSFYAPPGQHPKTPTLCSAAFTAARKRARSDGFTLIEGTAAWAEPSGLVSRASYESLRDEILDQLARAMPVQVALFGLHGAMMAEGYDDCEGDLLVRARALVGPDAVIGVELDPHCHLTQAMIEASTVMVTFKEVPHSDFAERADDMVDLALRAASGQIQPVMSVLDCRSIANFMTSRSPGRELVDDMLAMEGREGILSLSVVHGFPAADMADV